MLTKDEVFSNGKLKKELVNIPELGGDLIVSEMNGSGRDMWEQSLQARDKQGRLVNTRAKLVASTVVTDTGARMFGDDDIERLGGLPSSILDRLCDVAQRLNRLRPEDVQDDKKN